MKKIFLILIVLNFISCSENNSNKNNSAIKSDYTKMLEKYVAQNPDSIGYRFKLINSLDSLQLFKEALAQTDSLIFRDSLNNGLWFTKAQLLEEYGDTLQAIICYKRAIRIYPSAEAQLSLANLLAEKKDSLSLTICRALYNTAMDRSNDAHCNFISGVYYARTKQFTEALQFFDKCILNDYNYVEAYMEKGFIYFDQNNYKEALGTFHRITMIRNTYADAYYWMGKCHEKMNEKNKAIEEYKKSLALDPQLSEAKAAIERLTK